MGHRAVFCLLFESQAYSQVVSLLKQKALILKKTLYQESDLILKVLTGEGEKLDVMAKGALRSKKRFGGGVLEPLNYVELTFAPNKNQNNHWRHLNEATLIYDYSLVRTDYDRIKLALYFLKVITKIELESGSSYVFDLLLHALRAVEKAEQLAILKCQFEVKLLYRQGVLLIDSDLEPFLKTSMYDSQQLMKYNVQDMVRRTSYEMENYFEQLLELS
ncbi:MAG: DNA repair protein RecO [Bdellovibrionaceae bacterium]|nr:DNA repair protein RecO [Pseudobdellovibrionaceae bacterium]